MFSNNLRLNFLGAATLVAFVISGCLSPGTRLATTPNDASKSKTPTQSLAGTDDRSDRNDKGRNDSRKMIPVTGSGKEKRSAEPTKAVSQVDELVKEGDLLRKNKQFEDARVVYHKALLLSPDSPVVNHRLAIIADKQRLFSAADYHYQAALKARPRDVNLLSDFGYSYSLRGNEEQAEETLKKALAIDPKHKGAMANLGALYSQQNRYSDAMAMFRAGATEEETQRYLAELFPKERSGDEQFASMDRGHSPSNRATVSLPPENAANIKTVSMEELEAELDRRKHDSNVRRQIQSQIQGLASNSEKGQLVRSQTPNSAVNIRSIDGLQSSWDQDEVTGVSATMDSSKSQSSVNHPQTSRQADSHVQTTWGQVNGIPTDTKQQLNKSDQSRQIATQLGLSAGPGNIFPIISGFGLSRPDHDGVVPVGMTLDSNGAGRSGFAGNVKMDKARTEGNNSSINQSIGMTNGNPASRPYDGTWPNWSSDRSSARQSPGSSTVQWPNSGSSAPSAPNTSAPQWPFSSNR